MLSATNEIDVWSNFLGKWFDIDKVVHKDGKILSKPVPDMYLKAAENIGLQVSDCTIFED